MIPITATVHPLPLAGAHLVVPLPGFRLVVRLILHRKATRPRRRMAKLHGLNQHLLRDIGLPAR